MAHRVPPVAVNPALPQHRRQLAVAAAIVEEPQRVTLLDEIEDENGIARGSGIDIVGVDQHVIVVVNVLEMVAFAPVIECTREDEPATSASVVIDRNAGERQISPAPFFATLVEVGNAVERRRLVTYFAYRNSRDRSYCATFRLHRIPSEIRKYRRCQHEKRPLSFELATYLW